MIRTLQVSEAGVSRPASYAYAKEKGSEQAAHDIYVSPDVWTDAMHLLHLRYGQAVFSYETALFSHDLTDRELSKYSITIRIGHGPLRLRGDDVRIYAMKKELYGIGVTTVRMPFGRVVPVYDMERTVRDLLRNRSHMEIQALQDALK